MKITFEYTSEEREIYEKDKTFLFRYYSISTFEEERERKTQVMKISFHMPPDFTLEQMMGKKVNA